MHRVRCGGFILSFLLISLTGLSQSNQNDFRIWQLISFNGQASLRDNYREYESRTGDKISKQTDSYFNGIFQGWTKSYVIHPNFMMLDVNGIYNPEANRDTYIGAPGTSSSGNTEGIDASALFFKKKPLNVTANGSYYLSLQNIDNIARIRATSQTKGAGLSYFNKILPFSFNFNNQHTDQSTIGIDRRLEMDQKFYQFSANKSFSTRDHHSINYTHNDVASSQHELGNISNTSSSNDLFGLTDELSLGRKRKTNFSSSITNVDEHGSNNFHSFSAFENLSFQLPKNFLLSNSYNYMLAKQASNNIPTNTSTYHNYSGALSHHLFSSLESRLIYDYRKTNQNLYSENRNKITADFKYEKKIPEGLLTMNYSYNKELVSVKTPPVDVNIFHEEYVLSDNEIILLKNQGINIQTITVKNSTGSIVYQLNLDYILVDKSPSVEIIRVPGGMIANNSSVFIDYKAVKAGLFEYTSNYNAFAANVALLKGKLDVYYRYSDQNFNTSSLIENQVLNYSTRNVAGGKLNFHFISAGAEYEHYASTLIPYYGMRYFVEIQGGRKNLQCNLSGSYSDYYMTREITRRQDFNVTTKAVYSFYKIWRLDFDYLNRTVKGQGLDIKAQNVRLALTTTVYKLYFSAGSELYWSKTAYNTLIYRGLFFQLTRNFN